MILQSTVIALVEKLALG